MPFLQMKNTVYFHGDFMCLGFSFLFFPHILKSAKWNGFLVQTRECFTAASGKSWCIDVV